MQSLLHTYTQRRGDSESSPRPKAKIHHHLRVTKPWRLLGRYKLPKINVIFKQVDGGAELSIRTHIS